MVSSMAAATTRATPLRVSSASTAGRIAVLLPVYNGEQQLRGTLDSLAGQGVPFTVVVVDDGSTTPVAVDPPYPGCPVHVVRLERNGGIERALNAGLAHIARLGFEFVARLDCGDRCLPERLARQLGFLDAHPDVTLVGSDVEWQTADGRAAFRLRPPTDHAAIVRALPHTLYLIHPAVMMRTAAVLAAGGYRYDTPAAEDYDLFWRMARRGRVANLPETLLVAHYDPAGISLRRRRRQLVTTLRIRLRAFQAGEPACWIGVAKAVAFLATPPSAIRAAKRLVRGAAPRSAARGAPA
jgi:glycosyltransferase involved in cell wall biosynthesis